MTCRYIDCNFVNALSPHHLEPERLRRSILGALRFGKPVVLDLSDVDVWGSMADAFGAVQPGLLESLLDGSIRQNKRYLSLVRKGDGDQTGEASFDDEGLKRFVFVVLTSMREPPPEMVNLFHALRVKLEK